MRPLTTERALRAWEHGQRGDPMDQALALLQATITEVGGDELAHLPVGQRDALLCRLRSRTFGPEVRGFAACPKCSTRLEFGLDLRAFDVDQSLERRLGPQELEIKGHEIVVRLPDTRDLQAVRDGCGDSGSGRDLLLERCVLSCRRRGRDVPPRELPEKVVERLGERMAELDPLAELPLSIACARCRHEWLVYLDLALMMWHEVSEQAERLLQEIHLLARAYGWTEPQILALTPARRRFYIEQIQSEGSEEPAAAGRRA